VRGTEMSFITKLNRLSGKLKLAIFISALWFLFWVVIGWKGGSLLGGLAFGGTPLILIWGFWWMAVQHQKDAGLMGNRQDALDDGAAGKREFTRLVYPPTNRPTLKYKDHELEIIDISEKGLKLSNEGQIDLGRLIHGEAILLSGHSVHVDGEISWSLNNEVGLLMALIPSSIIAEERRALFSKRH
jgi:hypothetical protein